MLMANIVIAISAVFILSFAVWFERRRRLSNLRQRQKVGLSWLQSLRVLLADMQRHRGLTTGYLNGDVTLKHDIEQLQHSVGRDITKISAIDPWMEANGRWHAITQHWARLAGRYAKNTAENNMNQHIALIQNLLYLIDDMAQEHELLSLCGRDGKPLRLAWRELLLAAEFVGQARALGVGITTSQRCDSVNRIRLKYLCQKVEENTARVWQQITPVNDSEAKVEALLSCINSDIIKDRPTIAPQAFFLLASDALDGLHGHYDQIVEELKWHAFN